MVSVISSKTGTASSAAADGVGARTSAAKSVRAQSISCPTALITGISEAATARTTASSEKGNRSSKEPPPLPIMISSPSLYRLAVSSCRANTGAASAPCTGAGSTVTLTVRFLRESTVRISRRAAPVGLVITAIRSGKNGSGRFLARSKRPSRASFCFRSSSIFRIAPSPASSIVSTMIWYEPRCSYTDREPDTITLSPSFGSKPSVHDRPLNITACSAAFSSFRVK